MESPLAPLFAELDALTKQVHQGLIGSWPEDAARFADVAIVPEQPPAQPAGFYPEDRYVVTQHTEALAWLFRSFVGPFADVEGYGFWKEQLFGRLGNAANWYLAANPEATDRELCLAVLCEAYLFADEFSWDESCIVDPMIVIDNQVLDDDRWPLDATRPANAAQVESFLTTRGVL